LSDTPPSEEFDIQSRHGARQFPCGACGAELVYVPGESAISCGFCGHENPITAETTDILERDFEEWLGQLEAGQPHEDVETVVCDSCDAILDAPGDVTAMSCCYCGAPIVIEERRENYLRPEALLPFGIKREKARELFRTWLGSLWFAPSGLAQYARSKGGLEGVYLPYFTYDADTHSDYVGQRGDHYYVTETYTVQGPNGPEVRSRQVQRTRWSSASGHVFVPFDDVLVPASKSLPRKDVDKLAPWDLDKLVPFAAEYLSGFRAERHQIALPEGFRMAAAIMDVGVRSAVCRDIGGDVQRISSLDTRHDKVTFKYILLPLWISAYRYKDKTYRFLVNARTGEVRGQRPYSVWKIVFTVLAVLACIALVVLLLNR
jgi:DNA-directed RNA polymerase subunit RPC12/RpoP